MCSPFHGAAGHHTKSACSPAWAVCLQLLVLDLRWFLSSTVQREKASVLSLQLGASQGLSSAHRGWDCSLGWADNG